MKISAKSRIFLVGLLVMSASGTEARTAYVNDELEITLRTGASTKNSIVTMLPSGTPLTILSEDEDSGYSKIVTADDKEGYVLTRFITRQPIARDRLNVAQRKLEQHGKKIAELEAELRDLRSENSDYDKFQRNLESSNAQLNDELTQIKQTSANALLIAEENRTLKSRQKNLETQIEQLQGRNNVLAARSEQTWYIAGAGTLTLGILAGLILPRIKFKKRSRWGDL